MRWRRVRSAASNVANGDGNGVDDIFVRDVLTATTRRIPVSSNGAGGNGPSTFPAISGNGNVVAFVSDAANLVPGDTNGSCGYSSVSAARRSFSA